jgi:glucuronoarabinoxylan endo-1,4-beta-xylanase
LDDFPPEGRLFGGSVFSHISSFSAHLPASFHFTASTAGNYHLPGKQERVRMMKKHIFRGIVLFLILAGGTLNADINILQNPGFEDGTTSGWEARSCTISTVTGGRSGTYCGFATGRTATWQGIKQPILGKINIGQTVTISGWVKLDNASSDTIKLTVEQRDGAGTQYRSIKSGTGSSTQWTQLSGTFTLTVTGTLTYLDIYFEGPASGVNFYVDDAAVMVPVSTGQANVQINSAGRHQMIEGFGAAGAWYEGMLVNHPQKTALYNILFRDLGLDIYRIRNTYEIDSTYMNRTAQIIQAAEASLGRPLKIMISSWSPPALLKSNDNTREGTLKKDSYGNYMYPEFADWWYNSLVSWASRGVTADYINIQNEPDYVNSGWDTCYLWANETSTMAGYNLAFEAVRQKLFSEMGAAMPKMLAGETTGLSNIGTYINNLIDVSGAYGFAHHLYNCSNSTGGAGCGDEPDRYLTTMANFGSQYGYKPLFQTEYEDAVGAWPDAINLAMLMHNGLTVEGLSAYLYWDLFWGDSGGLVTLTSTGYTINNDYYGFKHYSAFIDDGWQRIEASSDTANLRVSAYISPDGGHLTAVLINTSDTQALETTFNPAGVTVTGGQVYRTTSAPENCALVGAFDADEPLVIPARSVTTLSLTVQTTPADCAQVQAYGYRLAEDLNGDCSVAWTDLMLLVAQWLSESPEAMAPNYSPDLVVNGNVDLNDLAKLMAQWLVCNIPAQSGCEPNWP